MGAAVGGGFGHRRLTVDVGSCWVARGGSGGCLEWMTAVNNEEERAAEVGPVEGEEGVAEEEGALPRGRIGERGEVDGGGSRRQFNRRRRGGNGDWW